MGSVGNTVGKFGNKIRSQYLSCIEKNQGSAIARSRRRKVGDHCYSPGKEERKKKE